MDLQQSYLPAIGLLVVIVFFVVGGILKCMEFVDRLKGKPNTSPYAFRSELAGIKKEIRELRKDGAARGRAIHGRINDLAGEVKEMRGRLGG